MNPQDTSRHIVQEHDAIRRGHMPHFQICSVAGGIAIAPHREIPVARAPGGEERSPVATGRQGGDQFEIRHRANLHGTGSTRHRHSFETRIKMHRRDVGAAQPLALEAEVRQRQRGQRFAPQLHRVGNGPGAAERIQGAHAMSEFTAAHVAPRLFEQRGVELLLRALLRRLRAFAERAFHAGTVFGLFFLLPRVSFLALRQPDGHGGEKDQSTGRDGEALQLDEMPLDVPRPAEAAPGEKQIQIHLQLGGARVTLRRLRRAGAGHHLVQFEQGFAIGRLRDALRQLRELQPVATRGQFVEQLAQSVDVALRAARPFRRDESLGADKAPRVTRARDQADVRELGLSVHEDDVARFDVAMDESV